MLIKKNEKPTGFKWRLTKVFTVNGTMLHLKPFEPL